MRVELRAIDMPMIGMSEASNLSKIHRGEEMARNYPAAECYRCGRAIPEGEPYWSLTRTREVMESGFISVLGSADQVGCLCDGCASSRPSIYDFLRDREPGTEPPWA